MTLHELTQILGSLESDNICAASINVCVDIDGCPYDIKDISIHKHYNQKDQDRIIIDIAEKE